MTDSVMNGGEGSNSYSKNSDYQRKIAETLEKEINEQIYKNLDVKTLSSSSNTIRLADLGCSTGPNTFVSMQNMMEAIKLKHASQCPDSRAPEFQVFFNDRASNDFNTLFTTLPPNKQYFAAGVPGSFHGRLFPESSLDLVYSNYALHWLSKIPEEVLDKNAPAWNKGRIHYLNAPKEVYDAYRSQFYEDINNFLNSRAKEIVEGGIMVIIIGGSPKGIDSYLNKSTAHFGFVCIASTLMNMAKEGHMSESLIDSYNIPLYTACPEEIIEIVEKNGHFTAEKVDFIATAIEGEFLAIGAIIKLNRAVLEGTLSEHFGNKIIDKMFERLSVELEEHSQLYASGVLESGQLFIVLKRK